MNAPTIPGWGLSAAQICRLQGHPVDLGGQPEFVPDQRLPPDIQAVATALNSALFAIAEQQLVAAGAGAQITFGNPYTIIKPGQQVPWSNG